MHASLAVAHSRFLDQGQPAARPLGLGIGHGGSVVFFFRRPLPSWVARRPLVLPALGEQRWSGLGEGRGRPPRRETREKKNDGRGGGEALFFFWSSALSHLPPPLRAPRRGLRPQFTPPDRAHASHPRAMLLFLLTSLLAAAALAARLLAPRLPALPGAHALPGVIAMLKEGEWSQQLKGAGAGRGRAGGSAVGGEKGAVLFAPPPHRVPSFPLPQAASPSPRLPPAGCTPSAHCPWGLSKCAFPQRWAATTCSRAAPWRRRGQRGARSR